MTPPRLLRCQTRLRLAPVCLGITVLFATSTARAQRAHEPKPLPPGPMVSGGRLELKTPDLNLTVLRYSGTAARLSPTADTTLDYTPGDRLEQRSADTFYHLGDLDLRYRTGTGEGEWVDVSSAFRRQPVSVLAVTPTSFAADLSSSLPVHTPLRVVRTWAVEEGVLALHFTLTNTGSQPVQIGGAGIAMVFNNLLDDRTLDQAYGTCSFYDPYIGEDAGYVQVSRLSGHGPVLLVVPDGHSPLEAWKPILDGRDPATGRGLEGNDPTPRGVTFEGSFDWMVHSAGFAVKDWKVVQEWNPPTAATIAAGNTLSFGVRFLVAPELRRIEATLSAHHRPVAVGVPGYIIPQDSPARLFLRSSSPVTSIVSEPVDALSIEKGKAPDAKLQAYTIAGRQWGRARLVITYGDASVQSIAYRVIKPEREVAEDLGRFLFSKQWFTDSADPFHRAPSVISYDGDARRQVTQDQRVWIAGLSDEAGAGSWLAAAMKQSISPDPEEIAKLESFVDEVLWGHLQESTGRGRFGVHKSLFFYQPDLVPGFTYDPSLNWKTWASWNKKGADDLGRSYNYPHVAAAYWSMYRVARNTRGMATRHPWNWYLDQAYETALAMPRLAPFYAKFGQMEGTVLIRVLEDLKTEGWTDKAAKLETAMHERANKWKAEAYPFGSEMPWDSTGQEEVYGWSRYFGYDDKADVTLNAILAYTPIVPSWGYNGSARRYWDFLYGGKLTRIERQLHHYGSGLNAIPLLSEYRLHPDDLYLLRAGYGGVMGPLTNIDEQGFASAAFHSFPDAMHFDAYSGDYGPNFFGHTMNTGTYITHDGAMGWLCFGGEIEQRSDSIHVSVRDSARNRVFLAPLGLWLTLDAGQFSSLDYDPKHNRIELHFAPASGHVDHARLRVQQTTSTAAKPQVRWSITSPASPSIDAGAATIPLGSNGTVVVLHLRR